MLAVTWSAPDETALRFVLRGEQRFYRTGDLVRMRVLEEPGEGAHALEWLGRMDRQIKLAGNRVELGEIEGVLTQHPFARECAVLTEGAGAEERLVAVVVPDAESMADATTGSDARTGIFSHEQIEAVLLAWAEQKLPAYMLPARMVFLDALPRTGSGKTDRRALADLAAQARVVPQALGERPVTRDEKVLAQLWSEVLANRRRSAATMTSSCSAVHRLPRCCSRRAPASMASYSRRPRYSHIPLSPSRRSRSAWS